MIFIFRVRHEFVGQRFDREFIIDRCLSARQNNSKASALIGAVTLSALYKQDRRGSFETYDIVLKYARHGYGHDFRHVEFIIDPIER